MRRGGRARMGFLAALGLDPMEMDLAKVDLPKVWSHDLSSEPAESGKIDMLREGVPHAMMAVTMGVMLASFVTPALFGVGPALAAAVLTRKRQWEQIQRNQNALKRLLIEQFGQAGVARRGPRGQREARQVQPLRPAASHD